MLHDAGSAGILLPASPATPTPSTKNPQSTLGPGRRRKTVSIVQPDTHAPQNDESPFLARASTMDAFPRTRYSTEANNQAFNPDTRTANPEGRYLAQSKSSGRLRAAASDRKLASIRSGDHARDRLSTDRESALRSGTTPTTPGPSAHPSPLTSSSPFLSSRPALSSFSPSSPSRLNHPPPSSPYSPRLPQSRFSFEHPLRKIALTTHLKSASIDRSDPADSFSSIKTKDLNRRSAPNFPPSHVETQPTPDSSRAAPSARESSPALASDAGPITRGPNAPKRRKSTLYSQQESPDVKRRMPSSTANFGQGRSYVTDNGISLKGAERYSQQDGVRPSISDETQSRNNEDIFLKIANSDSRRESLGRSELRRSRLRMPGNGFRSSTSRVSSDLTPSLEQLSRSNTFESPLHSSSQNGTPSPRYSSLPYTYSASAHPLDDIGRSQQPNFGSSSRSTVGLPRSRLSRASPENESTPDRRSSLHDSRAFRNSLSTIRSTSRQVSNSEATEKPRYDLDRSRQDGTESTLSTTAPSTVWDELEDLKSRIKKLELTGKLPPSSQEAMLSSSAERPRTATTTVTTMSSSPRYRRTSISGESDTITAPNPVHPLLQSALVKARHVVHKDVYTALEATATDAMALSQLLGTGKTPSGNVSVVNGYGSAERQSRRKADSVCRSLTELCLALSDESHAKQQSSPGDATLRASQMSQSNNTDEGTVTPTTLSYRKSLNQEPEELGRRQSSGARAASRLEARRASIANHGELYSSPDNSGPSAKQSPSSPAAPSRLSRLSVSMRTKRLQDDEPTEYRSPHSRSISRSMTDIGTVGSTQKASPRQQSSFGYPAPRPISDSQPQSTQPRTPTTPQSGIPLRRSMMTPAAYTPSIPRANIQAGSRRYGLSATMDGAADDMPLSPRQESSQTRIVAPSNKLASSYTPITQNRIRTNSLGGRRLGLRQRPFSTIDTKQSKSFNDSIE